MLDIRNAVKIFERGTSLEHTALNRLNLHLDAGEFVTIIGSNGAGKSTLFKLIPFLSKNDAMTALPIAAALLFLLLVILFFHTHIGMCIRAVGDNEDMVRASSINVNACKVLSFAVSNALIALSGALIAQYQGYADISSSTGILVIGLASVIIGEAIFGKRSVTLGFISAVAGSLIYRYIIALATRYSPLPAYMLKLVSAVIVALALAIPAMRKSLKETRRKGRGEENA